MPTDVEEKVARYMRDNGALNRAYAGVMTDNRRTPFARSLAAGARDVAIAAFERIYDLLPASLRERIKSTICNELRYCDRRKDIMFVAVIVERTIKLIEEFLDEDIKNIVRQIRSVAFWVSGILFRFFDETCDCKVERA